MDEIRKKMAAAKQGEKILYRAKFIHRKVGKKYQQLIYFK
jgi:hypothetical protein